MELGQQIKLARESKNLSQEELADQLGVSRQAVSKWENDSAVPQGVNRDLLSQILGVEICEDAPIKKKNKGWWISWGLAAVLLCVSVVMGFQLYSLHKNAGSAEGQWMAEPVIKSVQFYDKNQNIVSDVALWYNAAEIDSILIHWEGGTPDNIKVFYTPSGTETMEQTELLITKSISDGDPMALLSADALKKVDMGHVYIELDFGSTKAVSDIYNMVSNADF